VRCNLHAPTFARVAIVSKIDKDKAKIAFAEEHLPLHDLDANYGGLSSEVEIAMANIVLHRQAQNRGRGKAQGQEKKCKTEKHRESVINRVAATSSGNYKENAKPIKR